MMEFKDLINSPIFSSNRIVRYAGLHLVEEETLTDHICEISLLCLVIYKKIEKEYGSEVSLNLGLLLEKALVHDLEETVTNDIPRPVKYSVPEMKSLMDKVSEDYMALISEQVGVDFVPTWKKCKDETPEGYIIKVADMILVARKAYREVALKSNYEMLIVLKEVCDYMADLEDYILRGMNTYYKICGFLFNLVRSSREDCLNLYEKYKDRIENLNSVKRVK